MGALCDYWKSLIPLDRPLDRVLDRAQTNEHVAFLRYFKKDRHLYGLPEFVPASPAGSVPVSPAGAVPASPAGADSL
jgi:hypothetical protein